ncbi:potassium voltage-gated channel subfamily C member 3 [Aplysia californica]|uniref:Potassium voltage-gated channel subfamily C member 3 n=1 Tax=Aplysia californica TaxID=6500 RepID=A0ABM1AB08_APLCA|nr:potassium voltage-gated channel subfamily C member 3 [Aplysia californica]
MTEYRNPYPEIQIDTLEIDFNQNASQAERPLLSNGLTSLPEVCETSSFIQSDPSARVTFNVGGVVFQTSEATVKKSTNDSFKLADPEFLNSYYDAKRKEYFFDRDPEVFRSVLNYWRTGSLHLPSTMCGPQIKEELDFWGLKELDLEPCCWHHYNSWMKTIASLRQLERDKRPLYLQNKRPEGAREKSACYVRRVAMWKLLTDPSYSKPARVYAYVSLFFVILAIFSFCAATHSIFHIDQDGNGNGNNNNNNTIIESTLSSPLTSILSSSPLSPNSTTANPSVVAVTMTTRTASPRNTTEKPTVRAPLVHPALFYIDIICLVFFTVEYLLKLIVAPKRCKFIISFNAVIDVLAILPDYVEIIIHSLYPESSGEPNNFVQTMPFLRLLRAFRIFRLVRRVPGLWIMVYTLKASFKELSLMLVVLLVGTLLFSSVIFFVDDPKVFTSIPHGFWWAIVTMTTVGYGDMAPVTMWGQVVGSFTAICGVLMIGFTIPSLVNNFITFYQHVDFVVQKERLMVEHHREEMARLRKRKKSEVVGKWKAAVVAAAVDGLTAGGGGGGGGHIEDSSGLDFPHRRQETRRESQPVVQ